MQIFNTINELQKVLAGWRESQQTIGFVATMGGLHLGHLSLIKLAKNQADRVLVSIFVNPTQFAADEDFESYPRTLAADLEQLKKLGVDGIFTPTIEQIYPQGKGFERNQFGEKKYLFEILCGKTRPHFFFGVLQVVKRLFEIIKPDVAIFGQKDYQQLQIIKQFSSNIEIISAEILREKNGLAMSTRNQYLSPDERKIAGKLYEILSQLADGKLQITSAKVALKQHFSLDYLEILDANSLEKISPKTSKIAILSAVFLGKTRLIDNIITEQKFENLGEKNV
ncbi:MAG: pantoate--beta-alanine ligase [Candidatus Thioglobus sp.]|nr:pantoate--beta-alanine ligase [Candidatus Thioglobus sp.]